MAWGPFDGYKFDRPKSMILIFPVCGDEDVLDLKVAVHDAVLVTIFELAPDLLR